jgi:flagellar hook protein FlgE
MSLFSYTTREGHSRAAKDGYSRIDSSTHKTLQQAHNPVDSRRESLTRSPKVQSQIQLQQLLNHSPRVVAQAKLAAAMNSRSSALQRQQQPVQRQETMEDEELTQRQQSSLEDEESLQGKFAVAQKEELPEEEEPLQSKSEPTAQREAVEDEEPLQGKFEPTQREALEEDEEPLQGKLEPVQREASLEDEEPLQSKAEPAQKKENQTGLPDNLKAGVENLSGLAMDDVRVHYNSPAPSTIQALAYTQGTDIHVGPGQEQHLAHEAWHVAQQKQGRVQPTTQAKDVAINDDAGLEKEADVMGARASRMNSESKTT